MAPTPAGIQPLLSATASDLSDGVCSALQSTHDVPFGHPSPLGDRVLRATWHRHPDIEGVTLSVAIGMHAVGSGVLTTVHLHSLSHLVEVVLAKDLEALSAAGQNIAGVVIEPELVDASTDHEPHQRVLGRINAALSSAGLAPVTRIAVAPYALCPRLRGVINRSALMTAAAISRDAEGIPLLEAKAGNHEPHPRTLQARAERYQEQQKMGIVIDTLALMRQRSYRIDAAMARSVCEATLGQELSPEDGAQFQACQAESAITLLHSDIGVVTGWIVDQLDVYTSACQIALATSRQYRNTTRSEAA